MNNENGKFTDILNIQGEDIPDIDEELNALLEIGKYESVHILPGASNRLFENRTPYAQTHVQIEFDNEEDLRRCVRLLRWSDERLIALGSTISWAWSSTKREGMKIFFGVNWYDKDFYLERGKAFNDSNHLSYFRMFGKNTSDMQITTDIFED
jgi:hypothetical protein